jgi:hypothetical protein
MVASLQTTAPAAKAAVEPEAAAVRDAAKRKRIEEREIAKAEHAKFLAKQAAAKPQKDQSRAEWETKEKARKRELNRLKSQRWRANNREKDKAIRDRCKAKSAAIRKAKQIEAGPVLVGGQS